LPPAATSANSIAVDRENHPWFVDPVSGIAGAVAGNGQIIEFSIPAAPMVKLLQLSGVSQPLLNNSLDGERISVLPEEFGRLSTMQKESNCESISGTEMQQKAEIAGPREERRPQ